MAKENLKMEKPVWIKYNEEEAKAIILKLANKGMTAEKIGLVLRDQYGIPKVKIYGLKIKKVLEEKGAYKEPALVNLQKKVEIISVHQKKHKQDKKAHRALVISGAKLQKAKKYYIKK